uniref:Uncharacterized protein n=1 Tax=Panagrolaimus davidi TaxID=227884 RepID=A0A914PKK5_9BILA
MMKSEKFLPDKTFVIGDFDIEISKRLWADTFKIVTYPTIYGIDSAIDLLLFNGTSQAAERIFKTLLNSNFSTKLSDYFSNCSVEFLRYGTMHIICKTHNSVKNKDSKILFKNILLGLSTFVAEKDEKFLNEFKQGKVPPKLWEDTALIFLQKISSECFAAIDLLLHIREWDSDKRKEFFLEKINNLNYEEKLHWQKMLNEKKDETVENGSEDIDLPKKEISSNIMESILELTVNKDNANKLLKILKNYGRDDIGITSNDVFEVKKDEKISIFNFLRRTSNEVKEPKELKGDKEIIYGKVTYEKLVNALANISLF